MLFLRADEDFVPYTPRDKQNLHENLQGLGPGVQAESLELAIRKEVRATGMDERLPSWQASAAELTPQPTAQLGSHQPTLVHFAVLLGQVAGDEACSQAARGRAAHPWLCLPLLLFHPAFLLCIQHPYLVRVLVE